MAFDLNDVALFVQVVRSGSFAQAARQLGMPSNTISRRVQQLEMQLDTRLLQRSTRKLVLTQAGEEFYDRCVGAVDGVMEAAEQLASGRDEPSGLVRIAAMADFFDFSRWTGWPVFLPVTRVFNWSSCSVMITPT